jgi:primosomal protein N''
MFLGRVLQRQVAHEANALLAQLSKQRATGHMHLRRNAMAPRHCLGQLLHGVVRGIQHAFFQIRRNLPGQAPQPFYGRGRGNVHQIELRPGCL